VCVLRLSRVPGPEASSLTVRAVITELREGLTFVRSTPWLWATLAAATLTYLLFLGPTEVLLPYMVKNVLHGSAESLGLVFAAGGIGAICSALVMGQAGQPRRGVLVIYATWTAATLAVAGYGLANSAWQLMFASFAFNALETAGTIVWITLKQREVPAAMLGRVSSLDWLISIGLLPISFAVTGPVAAAIGAQTALVAAGAAGALVTVSALLLPGMFAVEYSAADATRLPESDRPAGTQKRRSKAA
jgi:DHA3 family tetracycline resistance protein-like MFS transporter